MADMLPATALPLPLTCRWGRGLLKYELQATGHTKGAMRRALRSQPYFLRVFATPPTAAPVPVDCSMVRWAGSSVGLLVLHNLGVV